ncbi:MAG: FAD:protein FMN transferase [Ginsengibacter sp.]
MIQISNLKEQQQKFKKAMRLMGNSFEITVVGHDKFWADECIDDAVNEIKRIEKLLTTFDNNSQTNQINNGAGVHAVKVDREVFELIQRSLRISDITQGAFDITYGSIDKSLWNFDRTMTALPDSETAKSMVHLVNYKNVLLNEKDCTVMLKEPGMRIGFGGIGKGYAAEMAKNLLKKKGVQSGVVNASGDLTAWGLQANKKPWTIGIADPDNARQAFSCLNITEMAVATSGNYEKYVLIDGKKYSHTVSPKTGLPITGIKSVTVITPNAEIADAMTTPVMIMGIKAGLNLINQMKNIDCIIIDDNNKVYSSKNINLK